MFICFSGIDGAGKSTLARDLVAEMERRGIRSLYVYNRLRLVISKPALWVARVLFLRGKDIFGDYEEYSRARKAVFRKRLLSVAYEQLLLTDYFFQVLFKVAVPLALGRNIVCDRYVYDTVVTDLAVDMNYTQERTKRVLKLYLRVLPKPDIVFLVDVPEEVAYGRKDDVPSIDYLKERRHIYLEVGQQHGMIVLDGSKDLASLESEILDEVFK